MKIYTKTGDKGETSLWGGKRVPKHHPRIEAYGTVDELNVSVGMVRDQVVNESRKDLLKAIQDRLFTIGSVLAADPEKQTLAVPDIRDADIELLEKEMDDMDGELPPLTNFILPGGHMAVSFAHQARVTCRRAERLCIALSEQSAIEPKIIRYLNRLSDYFFVLGRKMAQELRAEEIVWNSREQ